METPTARPVLLHPARCGKAARSETRCGGQTPSTGLNGFWSQHCMNKKCRSYDGGGGRVLDWHSLALSCSALSLSLGHVGSRSGPRSSCETTSGEVEFSCRAFRSTNRESSE